MHRATVEELEKALYTTTKPEENSHQWVMVFDNKRAITYKHGSHSSFKNGQQVTLYNVMDSEVEIKVTVSLVSEKHDFIVFELDDGEFPNYPSGSNFMYDGKKYHQLGVNQKREPTWKDGIVSKRCLGYYLGTTNGEDGDSGSGIFGLDGRFIGISVAKNCHDFSNIKTMTTEEVADHHPETKLISAEIIYHNLNIEDDENYEQFKEMPAMENE